MNCGLRIADCGLKSRAAATVGALLGTAMLAGCSSTTPTAVERALYDVQTNVTQQVTVKTVTNIVNEVVPQYVLVNVTNTDHTVQITTLTNFIPVPMPQVVLVSVTNAVTNFVETPKQTVTDTIQAGGSVLNTFLPGVGGIISTVAVGLLGLWAKIRSTKNLNDVAGTLTQSIETARSIIKSLPNGAAIGQQFDTFLVQHQADANVLSQITKIVNDTVSAGDAQSKASELLTLATGTPTVAKPSAT